jgi:TonB family protein
LLQKDKSKTKIKAVLQNEAPYFANLPAGNYDAIISIKGYKVTTKEIDLDCNLANEQNVVSEVVFLWEGDTKEAVKMNGSAFAVTGDDSEKPNKPLEGYNSKPDGKGELKGKAAYLPQPAYPRAARAVRATGAVQVEVLINEIGKVVYAKAIDGHPLLRATAVKAAQEAKFTQTTLQGMPVKVLGIITYNFVP